jgi:hypothetical protein
MPPGLEELQEFFTDFGGFHGQARLMGKGGILREKRKSAEKTIWHDAVRATGKFPASCSPSCIKENPSSTHFRGRLRGFWMSFEGGM